MWCVCNFPHWYQGREKEVIVLSAVRANVNSQVRRPAAALNPAHWMHGIRFSYWGSDVLISPYYDTM